MVAEVAVSLSSACDPAVAKNAENIYRVRAPPPPFPLPPPPSHPLTGGNPAVVEAVCMVLGYRHRRVALSERAGCPQELTLEEERFTQTLERGQKQLDELLEVAKSSGKVRARTPGCQTPDGTHGNPARPCSCAQRAAAHTFLL